MTMHLRKDWCPGALRPMPAKDGLLVRLRITGGIVPAATAHVLADLAERCGSGLFDLSARGNLQMRGVHQERLHVLQDGLISLGLLDGDAEAEAVRNVIASPMAGLHRGIDIRPLTAALERRLSEDASLHALPAKFGFLIDDDSAPSLADVPADVRFDLMDDAFSIGLGGARDEAVRVGSCGADALVACAAHVACRAIELFSRHPDTRRMRELSRTIGRDAMAEAFTTSTPALREMVAEGEGTCASSLKVATSDTPSTLRAVPLPRLGAEWVATLAAPFGRLDATMLHAAADLGATTAHRELRLTPWRTILVPGATGTNISGFINDPSDPRLRVAACVGADGCESGTTRSQADAAWLAASLDGLSTDDILLHVSGCAKGCAKASPSPVTLVARNGRYDLVRNGRAGDPPLACGLDLAAARTAIAAALGTT